MTKPKNHTPLTAERLRELLSYDPKTGIFRRLVSTSNSVKVGDIAGNPDGQGYLEIRLDGHRCLAHRLAWLYVHGRWPTDQIDHINGEKSANQIANLREASNAENCQNRVTGPRNTSGHQGVCWFRQTGKWMAYIQLAGRKHHLGYFANIADAIEARSKAKSEHHTFQPYHRGKP